MKSKQVAEKQARKILTYYVKQASKLKIESTKIESKPPSKNIKVRINRMDKIDYLKNQAAKLELRGRKAWACYKNNPLYW